MLNTVKMLCNLILPPGTFILLVIGFTFWLYRRDKTAAKILAFITLVMYLCSTPFISGILLRSLENRYQPPSDLDGDILIMLTGGATLDTPDIDGQGDLSGASASRLLTAARLQKKTDLPIILSGGQVNSQSGNEAQIAKRFLIGLGIPVEKIIMEESGLNTTQSAVNTKAILDKYGYKKPILITSAYHIPRSVLNFSRIKVEVVPYPCNYQYNTRSVLAFSQFVPSSFCNVWTALHEYLGIVALSLPFW